MLLNELYLLKFQISLCIHSHTVYATRRIIYVVGLNLISGLFFLQDKIDENTLRAALESMNHEGNDIPLSVRSLK